MRKANWSGMLLPGCLLAVVAGHCIQLRSPVFRIQTIATVVKSVRFGSFDFLNSERPRLVNSFAV